jgi:ferredoxin-NADP reductase
MRDATLVRARMISPSVRELTFDAGDDHTFTPGHWVTLYLPQASGDPLKRQYSIASPPRKDGTFDLAVTKVEGGPMSTHLHDIQPGAKLRMLEAQGLFVLQPIAKPIVMVATGTGVAPFRSMLEHLPEEKGPSITLLFGARTEADLIYAESFEALARRWPRFTFLPTLSRASEAWQGRRGYVQTHLGEVFAKASADVDMYICGLTKMVKDVRTLARESHGVDRKHVHIERYD